MGLTDRRRPERFLLFFSPLDGILLPISLASGPQNMGFLMKAGALCFVNSALPDFAAFPRQPASAAHL